MKIQNKRKYKGLRCRKFSKRDSSSLALEVSGRHPEELGLGSRLVSRSTAHLAVFRICAGCGYSCEVSVLRGLSGPNGAGSHPQSCWPACPWTQGTSKRIQLIQNNFKYIFPVSYLPPSF